MIGHNEENLATEKEAVRVVVADPRYQVPQREVKAALLEHFAVKGQRNTRVFDVVRTDVPAPPLTVVNLDEYLPQIRLGEIKSTKAAIKNRALNGFFFGATENEWVMARALGDRYLFLFVVLNAQNDFGRPFFVPLTLAQVENRTRTRRIQYQVNFRTDMEVELEGTGDWVRFPGHGGIQMWPIEDQP
jgi:hypothetical protein